MNRLIALIGILGTLFAGTLVSSPHAVSVYLGVSSFGEEFNIGADATAGVGYNYAVSDDWVLNSRVGAFRYQSGFRNKTLWTYSVGATRVFPLDFDGYRFHIYGGGLGAFSSDFPGLHPEVAVGLDKKINHSQTGYIQFKVGQEAGAYAGVMIDLFAEAPVYVAPKEAPIEPKGVVGKLAMDGPETLLSLAIRSRRLLDIDASPVRNEIQQTVDYGVIDSDFEYFEPWRLVTWLNAKQSIENTLYYRTLIQKTKRPFTYTVEGPKGRIRYVDIFVDSFRGNTVKQIASTVEQYPGNYRFEWNGSTDYDDFVPGGEYVTRVQVSDESKLLYESQSTVNVSVITQDELADAYAVNWRLILDKTQQTKGLDLHLKPIRKIDFYLELGRALSALGQKPDDGQSIRDFTDLGSLSDSDEYYLSVAMVTLGDLSTSTTAFYPNQLITRADQALLLARFMNFGEL